MNGKEKYIGTLWSHVDTGEIVMIIKITKHYLVGLLLNSKVKGESYFSEHALNNLYREVR